MFIVLNDQYIILEENTINAWCKVIKKDRVLGCPAYQTLSLMIIYFNNLLTVLCDMGVHPNTKDKRIYCVGQLGTVSMFMYLYKSEYVVL
jgi:hypothetical protein